MVEICGQGLSYDEAHYGAGYVLQGHVTGFSLTMDQAVPVFTFSGLDVDVSCFRDILLAGIFGAGSTTPQAQAFWQSLTAGGVHVDFTTQTAGGARNGTVSDDLIEDGSGSSLLAGFAMNDALHGGAGPDFADWSDLQSGVTVIGGHSGPWTTVYTVISSNGADTGYTVEDFRLTGFADIFSLTDNASDTAGHWVDGGAGNDSLTAQSAYDTLRGGGGRRVRSDAIGFWGADHGVRVDLTLAANRVQDQGFGNVEDGRGRPGVYGADHADRIIGRIHFADDLWGEGGNDTIFGHGMNDSLSGDDLVGGGAGIDTLTYWFSDATQGVVVDLAQGRAAQDGFGARCRCGVRECPRHRSGRFPDRLGRGQPSLMARMAMTCSSAAPGPTRFRAVRAMISSRAGRGPIRSGAGWTMTRFKAWPGRIASCSRPGGAIRSSILPMASIGSGFGPSDRG